MRADASIALRAELSRGVADFHHGATVAGGATATATAGAAAATTEGAAPKRHDKVWCRLVCLMWAVCVRARECIAR